MRRKKERIRAVKARNIVVRDVRRDTINVRELTKALMEHARAEKQSHRDPKVARQK